MFRSLSITAPALPRQTRCWLVVCLALALNGVSESANGDHPPNFDATTATASHAGEAQAERTPIRRADDASARTGRSRPASVTGTLAALGLVLASAYLVLHVMRRRQSGRSTSSSEAIDVLASRRLDGQSTLHLVRIGRRVLAIGSAAGSLRTLAVLDDPEEIAGLMPDRDDSPMETDGGRFPFRRRTGRPASSQRITPPDSIEKVETTERSGRAA